MAANPAADPKNAATPATDDGWITEASAELDRLWVGSGNTADALKRTTVIELVRAQIEGRTRESVFARDDTCSRNTYTRWTQDQTFLSVVENVGRIARRYKDQRGLRSLRKAAELLAVSTPYAVARLAAIINNPDDRIALSASTAILDRAALETAVKGMQITEPSGHAPQGVAQVSLDRLSDDELRMLLHLQRKMEGTFSDEDDTAE